MHLELGGVPRQKSRFGNHQQRMKLWGWSCCEGTGDMKGNGSKDITSLGDREVLSAADKEGSRVCAVFQSKKRKVFQKDPHIILCSAWESIKK